MFLLSCWYPRKELAARTAVLSSGLILATAFSGLIAAGIFAHLDGKHGMAGWQWLFIVEGAGSFAVALLAFFILPDFPGSNTGAPKWLLSAEERRVAVDRMERDRVTEAKLDSSVRTGLSAALNDFKTWIFVIMLTASHSAYGFNNFFPTIVKGLKFGDTTVTLLLTAPPYLLGAIVAFCVALSSDKFKERGYHIAIPMVLPFAGFLISVVTTNRAARYAAAFMYICGCFASNALVFSWASNTLSQSAEKRACVAFRKLLCSTSKSNLFTYHHNLPHPFDLPINSPAMPIQIREALEVHSHKQSPDTLINLMSPLSFITC